MTTVTVYSKPNCPQCLFTVKKLAKLGVSYAVVDVTESPEALAYVMDELGYTAAPVVVVNEDPQNHWSGYKESKLEALAGSN